LVRIGSGNGDEVESQAAAWAVICAERPLDDNEQRELDFWLAASSRNLGAYLRASAIWSDVDRVVALGDPARAAAEPEMPIFPRWRRYAIAASLALVSLSGAFAYDRLAGRIATGHGEVREIVLDDGSRLTLDSNSAVQVRYSAGARRVTLRRGEALFSVAHDPARPFLVSADEVVVRAVGTRFAVGFEDEEVAVTVEEGVVAVDEADTPAPARLLRRNEQFVAAPTGSRKAMLERDEVERRLAWRRGMLVFQGETLGRAAAEVNRYSAVRVTIDDPTLARAEFIGVFHIGDGRAFAQAAAQAFNGEVIAREDGLHLVRQQNSPSH
jgi:transmembrane sensor